MQISCLRYGNAVCQSICVGLVVQHMPVLTVTPINCYSFQDCKSLLVTSLTRAST